MLKRCIEKDLVQNWRSVSSWQIWEWSLAYIISKDGIKVDHAKVELIVKLPATTTVKAIRQLDNSWDMLALIGDSSRTS